MGEDGGQDYKIHVSLYLHKETLEGYKRNKRNEQFVVAGH